MTLILAQEITDPKLNSLGKEVSYAAMIFGGACLNKISCDLQKYDVITAHTFSVRSTHIRFSANHMPSGYSMIQNAQDI